MLCITHISYNCIVLHCIRTYNMYAFMAIYYVCVIVIMTKIFNARRPTEMRIWGAFNQLKNRQVKNCKASMQVFESQWAIVCFEAFLEKVRASVKHRYTYTRFNCLRRQSGMHDSPWQSCIVVEPTDPCPKIADCRKECQEELQWLKEGRSTYLKNI